MPAKQSTDRRTLLALHFVGLPGQGRANQIGLPSGDLMTMLRQFQTEVRRRVPPRVHVPESTDGFVIRRIA